MPAIIRTPLIKSLDKGFNMTFAKARDGAPTFWAKLATTVPSSTSSNVYAFMKKILRMQEWIGPRTLSNLENFEYELRNKLYERSVSVNREQFEDDNLGLFQTVVQELGEAVAKWPDDLVLEALEAGETGLGFDGLPFFSASHDLDPAGVQSNLKTGSALTSTTYEARRAEMMKFTSEIGKPMGVRPNVIGVPPALEMTAKRIVNADLVDSGETNVLKGSAEVLVIDELASSTDWYLFDTRRVMKPLLWQLRRAPVMTRLTQPNDEGVFYQRELTWGVDGRGVVGYGPWWNAMKCKA